MTYDDIAERLNFGSRSGAYYAVQSARAFEQAETPEAIRADMTWLLDDQITRMRLHATQRAGPRCQTCGHEPKALSVEEQIKVSSELVKLVDRKAKLHGVDAPTRRAIEVTMLTDQFLRDERQRLLQRLVDAGFDPEHLPSPDDVVRQLIGSRPIEVSAQTS